jgi:hypothetical protein
MAPGRLVYWQAANPLLALSVPMVQCIWSWLAGQLSQSQGNQKTTRMVRFMPHFPPIYKTVLLTDTFAPTAKKRKNTKQRNRKLN